MFRFYSSYDVQILFNRIGRENVKILPYIRDVVIGDITLCKQVEVYRV